MPKLESSKNLLFNSLVSVRCDKAFDTLTASERQEHVSNKAAKLRKEKKKMKLNLRHSNAPN